MLVNESAGFEEVENALIGQRKSASCNANLHFAALAAATPQYACMLAIAVATKSVAGVRFHHRAQQPSRNVRGAIINTPSTKQTGIR